MRRPQSRPHDAPSYCGLIVSALVLMLLGAAFVTALKVWRIA